MIGFSMVVVPFLGAFRWSRMREEKTAYASQRELHAHGEDDQSHVGYALAWFRIEDRVKLLAYRIVGPEQPPLLRCHGTLAQHSQR
jgi:hypothetical protein